jgi:bifunctional ADP-heptose synthase (sugar kinase/adenylyltransferase)
MLDSRTKILPPDQAVALWRKAAEKPLVVTGYFDPLLAQHVRRLDELAAGGTNLLVVLVSPERPLLNLSARAELVAALRSVCCVVPCREDEAESLLEQLREATVVREEAADMERRRNLARRVMERQSEG